jgi:predicted acyltransferase
VPENNEDRAQPLRQAPPKPENATASPSDARSGRLLALDAYRGFIMVVLAGCGFGLREVAGHFLQAAEDGDPSVNVNAWEGLRYHFTHPEWDSQTGLFGCSFWDLIQPSFMFMVGVAMVYSYASRKRKGATNRSLYVHALVRSLVLVLLAIFLASQNKQQTEFVFFNVLAQIGLGYFVVFLLLDRKLPIQLSVAAIVLVGYWVLFALHPVPGPDYDFASVGIEHTDVLPGLFGHWTKNTNVAADFDRWLLNLFPRAEPFKYQSGGYTTLNFVPSIVTMLLGVMAAGWLRGRGRPLAKFGMLALAGIVCMAAAVGASLTVCPVVKRIWTPSWVLFAGAYTFWMLAAFYLVTEVIRFRVWAWPLMVVGMNSIAIYMMFQTLRGWTAGTLQTHLGQDIFMGTYGPVVEAASVLLVFWLVLYWMYRNRYFVRI